MKQALSAFWEKLPTFSNTTLPQRDEFDLCPRPEIIKLRDQISHLNKTKDQTKDQTKEQATDQTKDQTKDKTKEQASDQTKEQATDQTKEQASDQTKEQATDQTKEQATNLRIHKVKHLALSGGGVKGFGYIGCFQALKDLDLLDIEEMAGTSIGAVFAFFYVLKCPPEELFSFIKKFDYKMIKSIDFINIFRNWGIETGEKSVKFLQSMVRHKLHKSDITFRELYEYNRIKLTIVATHLNTCQSINYNHINTPDHSVIQAIRKSIAIPGLFSPVMEPTVRSLTKEKEKEEEKEEKEQKQKEEKEKCCKKCSLQECSLQECPDCKNLDYYVDGAVLNNFPIDQVTESENTLGFCFVSDEVKYTEITCFENYVQQIFNSGFYHNTIHKLQKYRMSKAHIIVLDSETNSLQVDFDYQTKKNLWQEGYNKVIQYYQSLVDKHPILNPDIKEFPEEKPIIQTELSGNTDESVQKLSSLS